MILRRQSKNASHPGAAGSVGKAKGRGFPLSAAGGSVRSSSGAGARGCAGCCAETGPAQAASNASAAPQRRLIAVFRLIA